MFKKSVSFGEQQGIQYAFGKVRFRSFQLSVYCYVTDGVLIDTGANSLHKLLTPFFDKSDIDQVIITHDHEDHTGGAAYVQQTKGVPVYMHEMSAPNAINSATYPLYRKVFWGVRKPFKATALSHQFESRTAKWDVIDTPGHAADHLAFYNHQTGHMYTGDLFVSPVTKVVLSSESIPAIVQSLERVLQYDFNEVICHHAGILTNGRELLVKKKDNLEQLIDRVLTLHQQGMDKKEIHKILFPKKYPISRFSSGEWHSIHMITSILADENLVMKGSY